MRKNTAHDFIGFCALIGFPLEPFQRKIARAAFAAEHELCVLLARGNGKTTVMAALAVHHLLSVPRPAVYVAASSRDQATVLYEAAREFASHPALAGEIVLRHLELRVPGGHLRVLASDAPKVHGLSPTLALVDELHAHPDDSLYVALRAALHKSPGARMVVISTAAEAADSPLGRLRARGLAQPHVKRSRALTEAHGGSMRLLEWAVPDDADIEDPRVVKQANPASWITVDALRDQREALPDLAYRRYLCDQWAGRESAWLPPGAWQAAAGETDFQPGERIWVGVDLSGGGGRSDTAVVWLNERLHVGCQLWAGEHDASAEVSAFIGELASTYTIAELVLDFWRASGLASEFEQRGLTVVSYPQTDSRLIPASARLHAAILEQRLVHPDDPHLNAHVHAGIARHSRRGWRIDRPGTSAGEQVDGLIALAMALDRAEHVEQPVRLLGWL
ncbi:MAG TPA: terminase large subunit [Gaiellaceae bacterium]|nr:terminase large subunit [Gaiellaceae bacterium]